MDKESVLPPDEKNGLTEIGKKTAASIASNIADVTTGSIRIWTGPATRCTETAAIIGRIVGTDPSVDPRLDERKMVRDGERVTLGEFRSRQERGYLNPSRVSADEEESPFRIVCG